MRFYPLYACVVLLAGEAPALAAPPICAMSSAGTPPDSACLSADADGSHLRVQSSNAPRLDVTVGGRRAFVVDPIGVTFAEPGARAISGFSPLVTLNETNLTTNNKHGLRGVLYTDNATSVINANLLALDIFTPPDNGGDVSGAYIRQTGGGNALSVFNLCGERPKGFSAYCGQGFAIEAQVDGTKNSIFASTEEGVGLLSVIKGASGTGLAIVPSEKTRADTRAIHVGTYGNRQENFFVEMGGKTFARGEIQSEGGMRARSSVGRPVFEADANDQAAFFVSARTRGAVAFLAKPEGEAGSGAVALAVQDMQGRDLARIDMEGKAAFRELVLDGSNIRPVLRTTAGPLGGERLARGHCAETLVSVPGALPSMTVSVSPAGGVDPGDGFFVRGLVTERGEVAVKVCNAGDEGATPKVASFAVAVTP
jgi:hypothetical protein